MGATTLVKKRKKKQGSSRSAATLYRKLVIGLWAGFVALLLGFPLYLYTVSVDFLGLFGGMPSATMLENAENDLASELWGADGKLLGKYFRENRENAAYDEISPYLVHSLKAVEDARFEEHSGLDGVSLIRVAIKSVLLGQNKGGGSTLSQQTAKVMFDLRTDEQYEGKLHGINYKLDMLLKKTKEWILAVQLERTYTKKEILALYLNTVSFGNNTYGVKVASKVYFDKTPNSLNLQESALLAGVVQNPTRLNPVRQPENALHRRNVVLHQMVKYGYLTEAQFDSVKLLPLKLEYRIENHNEGPAPYFRSVIREFLSKWARENGYNIYKDGLKIYTTIDSRMQRHAEQVVASHMASLQTRFEEEWRGRNPWIGEDGREIRGFLEQEIKKTEHYRKLVRKYGAKSDSVWIVLKTKRPMRVFSYKGEKEMNLSPLDSLAYYKRFLHAGFMAMDPATGAIKAWVGGVNHTHFKYDHVQQGKRQPGSTFKPFVYATAIENGYSPCYQVYDVPRSYETGSGTPWEPKNSDGKWTNAPMSLREALARSTNSVTAEMMHKMKPENVVAMARRMGISSELEPVLALSLGVNDVSVHELVGAYSTFVNRGVYTQPYYITRIEDKNGNLLYKPEPVTREALNEETAYLMLHMLSGGAEMGIGSSARLSPSLLQRVAVGAKTGTTQNGSDGWFMGVTPELVAGAWVGGDSRHIRFPSWTSGQGARTAMPIWDQFMVRVMNDKALGFKKTAFSMPEKPLTIETNCDRYGRGTTDSDSVEVAPRPVISPDDVMF
ncbi:penicillin-binding protein 1A [Cesiribacter andamanensis]|uniref:Penicillin-binding protein 1A n=1 Tax=Cesiribacter andamanensis AMV16 TaxID=1279009 RepID=M7NRF7_9BACT|nr:transglycosylase domain-containing protein [Cesiribacter andamanensis]EMR01099.1 Penicillin-binding protein 1A [Cesiribacter andamanensis AMV16]